MLISVRNVWNDNRSAIGDHVVFLKNKLDGGIICQFNRWFTMRSVYLTPLYTFLVLLSFFQCPQLFTEVEVIIPFIVRKIPHAANAFTQGLAIDEVNNVLYESTGLYGQSCVRQIDLEDGKILKQYNLPLHLFGEGIALAHNRLIQLTWNEKTALVYSKLNFDLLKTFSYTGEGWGLCFDEGLNLLWMSDGTSLLQQRNPDTFKIKSRLQVHLEGKEVNFLNDLVCTGRTLYVNVWGKDYIYRIDKYTGEVTGKIDASNLLSKKERARLSPEAILNGIAYQKSSQTFFLTGKLWPYIYEVSFK